MSFEVVIPAYKPDDKLERSVGMLLRQKEKPGRIGCGRVTARIQDRLRLLFRRQLQFSPDMPIRYEPTTSLILHRP